ncbi:response regulator transcription factor [Rhizobium sp. GCM10022189]|uniref:response regulator transcription factor n=1 Tax=Rhizobium sp. GCM10022189 TaxID=3252654 RepID=UPI00360DB6BC
MTFAVSEKAESPIAILVDDDASVCESLGNLLNSVGIDAITFSSGHELLNARLPDRPSCLVLDVRMPGISGLDLQSQLTQKGVATPIVFLTGHGDIAMSVQAMKAGAHDFLTKPVREQTFLDAIFRAIKLDTGRREVATVSNKFVTSFGSLSIREREVLRMVVDGELNKQIAHTLGISQATVKLHRSNGMKKMQVASFAQLYSAWHSLPAELKQ